MSRSLHALVSEDSNQFGPGSDLIVSLLAVLLVLTLVTTHLYRSEKARRADMQHVNDSLRSIPKPPVPKQSEGGDFRLAKESFSAAEFQVHPVTGLVDPAATREQVRRIVAEYHSISHDFPFIFVVGHSSQIDALGAADRSVSARRQRNWEYAGRRAARIAEMIAADLDSTETDRLVVVTTGEFDLRNPTHPNSSANAWVEVVFGKDWKPPARTTVGP